MKKIFILLVLLAVSAVSFASVNVGIFKYELKEASHTADLIGPVDTSTISGAIVIPDSIVYDDTTYMVTCISYNAFLNCRNITSVSIPNSVNEIRYTAFYGCSSLTTVNIPEGVTTIASSTFGECTSLVSVSLPSTLKTIGLLAFSGCSSLVSVNLPYGLTTIKGYAFDRCSSLASVVLPNTVTKIDSYIFSGCDALVSVTISNSLDTLSHTFNNCPSLHSVVIPEGVSAIDSYAFLNTGLSEVTIPASVSYVGQYAFMNSPIQRVRCLGAVPAVCHNSAFSDYSGRLFVPAGSEDVYANADIWNNFTIVRPRYKLYAVPDDSTQGFVAGTGIYCLEENVLVMAAPVKDYAFDGWSDGAVDNPRYFSVPFDAWSLDSTVTPSIEDGYSIYLDTTITAAFVPHITDSVFVHDTAYVTLTDTITELVHDTVYEQIIDTVYEQVTDTVYLEYDGGSAMEYSLADLNVYYFMGRVVNTDNIYIKLYDAIGKLLAKGSEDIDMSNLPSAVYIVTDDKGGFLKIVHENSY